MSCGIEEHDNMNILIVHPIISCLPQPPPQTCRRDCILMLHTLTVIIVNSMKGYYPKEFIRAAILEGIKFCVARLH